MPEYQLTPEGAAAFKALEELDGVTIKVGWPSGGETAEIAMYNELGTSTIPARPFMKQAFENAQDEVEDFVVTGLKKVATSGAFQQFLNLLGVKLVDIVQSEIEEGSFTPNAPSTIRKKGSAHPLIDTATMKNSISFEIGED